LNNIKGCINRIKDIIANIDTQLIPGKIVATDEKGVIRTTNTSFPLSSDSNKVLTGKGEWVNIGTLSLTEYSTINDASDIIAKDSINTAFAKLSNQIDNEVNNRITAIKNEASTRKNADDALSANLKQEV
jgi:hypothetical protein